MSNINKALKEIIRLGQLPPNLLGPEELARMFHTSEKARGNYSNDLVGLKAVGGDKAWLGHSIIGKGANKIAVVGKGVTFDSGGISIKPGHNMKDMKFDMLGAATAYALSITCKPKKDIELHLIAPCAENTFHSNTFRPGDILNYPNGIRVEIDNTDAEGRLILADGIIAAKKHDPELIITIATLTGAAKAAVGEATAVFSNDQELCEELMDCADYHGELIWQLPLWDCHRKAIDVTWDKSNKGEFISNCVSGQPGASTAAAFIERFIGDTVWIHLDIAGSAYKDGTPTGVMLKTLTSFINNY